MFLIGFLFVSCGTSNSCDAYFSPVSVDKIKDISLQDIKYETMYVDPHFPMGSYDIPLIPCNIRYNTKSHYTVIVTGCAVLRNSGQTDNSHIVDSVSITMIAVKRPDHKLVSYSNKPEVPKRKPLKECPIPVSVRDEIREDFLTRMKYMKFHLNTTQRVFCYTYPYRLWE